MESVVESKPLLVTSSVFEPGQIRTKVITADPSLDDPSSPPKPLRIVTPTISGSFPVIFFFHGFYLRNQFYTDLLTFIASHGYILVAPQLCKLMPPSGQQEVNDAGKVINWIPKNLQSLLPQSTKPNLKNMVLAGHSRGGKTAFAVALGHAEIDPSIKFSALIGVDPVAGASKCIRTDPKILTYKPESFDLNMPVAVLGTGLGPKWKIAPPTPPCAPDGVNHKEFFYECKPPRGHFVAADYGHMDVLDDDLPGWIGSVAGCLCKSGKSDKDAMRRSVGGIMVAFLEYSLFNDKTEIMKIVKDPSVSPARLDPEPEFDE